MNPFALAFFFALGLGVALLLLILAYRLVYHRLAPDSPVRRYFQMAIVFTARTLRYLSRAYALLALALIALFWYLTVTYS
jgi:sterol desaturase/sphingolipid hydroxylase (fatty acid hydroxylase superfamily)